MSQVKRISAPAAKKQVETGKSLLICIYDDQKFNATAHLDGAIPMSRFLEMKPNLPKNTSIIFY